MSVSYVDLDSIHLIYFEGGLESNKKSSQSWHLQATWAITAHCSCTLNRAAGLELHSYKTAGTHMERACQPFDSIT